MANQECRLREYPRRKAVQSKECESRARVRCSSSNRYRRAEIQPHKTLIAATLPQVFAYGEKHNRHSPSPSSPVIL